MKIPEDAYDAAAKAVHRYDLQEGLSGFMVPGGHHIGEARAALEAAAPIIAAQALREVAEEWAGEPAVEWTAGDVVYALRFRINQLDPKGNNR